MLVLWLAMGEETKGEESQQRAVGVGCYGIDGIDERCGVYGPEKDDEDNKHDTDGNVHPFTKRFVTRLPTDIYTVAGGKGC